MPYENVSRKRRRQKSEEGYDYEEITVEEIRKKVIVKESFVKNDQKGHSATAPGDTCDCPRSDTRRLRSTPPRLSTRRRALPKKNTDKAVSRTSRALKKSICADLDADSCSSDTCSNTSCTEADDRFDAPHEETRRRIRGHCSENLKQVPPHSDAYTGRLPDRGHISAPPNLDATWTMTSHLYSTSHKCSSRIGESAAEYRNEVTEECWCSSSESESECESRCDSPPCCSCYFDKGCY